MTAALRPGRATLSLAVGRSLPATAPVRETVLLDRNSGFRDACARTMHNPSRTQSAVFRVVSRTLLNSTPQDCSETQNGVVQERLVIPLNEVMGRYQLGQSSAGLCLRAPGVGREFFFEKKLDYFDRECSKRHCVIEMDDRGKVRVRDLSSRNGTWLRRSPGISNRPLDGWEQLRVGVSYPLELHHRIQLGARSSIEYEFLGLTSDAHIRVRYCSKSNDAMIHEHDWEWIPLPPTGEAWHTSHLKDTQGQPCHGAPHFSVNVRQNDDGYYLATISYDEYQGKQTSGYTQTTGSKVYGAELVEYEEYGDSELYQVGYEVLLPGGDSNETRGYSVPESQTPHFFLRSEYLVMRALVDKEGWTTRATLDFSEHLGSRRHSTEITFNRRSVRGDDKKRKSKVELAEHQYYSAEAKSLRHAIVCALVERRLQDQQNPHVDPTWLTSDAIIGLTNFHEISQKDFINNASKWRSDIAKLLEANASEFQRSMGKDIAIPEEQDWKSFVEFNHGPEVFSLRLHPSIQVYATREP